MDETRSIDIDFDVHKMIELARSGFSETPNDVLRRLLGIDGSSVAMGHEAAQDQSVDPTTGRAWVGKGVSLPEGTLVRMDYNGRRHVGSIEDGSWHVEGNTFASPSAAASGTARTRAGTRPTLDGWIYWEVRLPGSSDWIGLKDLRRRMRE